MGRRAVRDDVPAQQGEVRECRLERDDAALLPVAVPAVHLRSVDARHDVRVRDDEPSADDPPRSLDAEPAREAADAHDGAPRRPDAGDPWQVNFDEDELDNQDPHGKHAAYTLDEPPQELNSAARVGEGMKPAERLALEQSDVPLKPKNDS